MTLNLTQNTLKFIFLLLSLLALTSCRTPQNQKEEPPVITGQFELPSGLVFPVRVAYLMPQQTEGLSGLKPNEFSDYEGIFFFYNTSGMRQFWMPDTHFNLDIIFLDKYLKVVAIEKNMQAHPGHDRSTPIPRTKSIFARYVIEVKSKSELANHFHVGETLRWRGKISFVEIESEIRHWQ